MRMYLNWRDKSLTLFLRAPKVTLSSLNAFEIVNSYKIILNINNDEAIKYAKLTTCYAYGYQLLGSLLYNKTKAEDLLEKYDANLIQNSYLLTWEKLSNKEHDFLIAMLSSPEGSISEELNITNGNFQVYRKRLIDKGLISSQGRGCLDFALPRFKVFVLFEKQLRDTDFA